MLQYKVAGSLFCRNIGVPGGAGGIPGSNQQAAQQAAQALAQMARASGPSLAEVLKPEVIIPLLQVGTSMWLKTELFQAPL